jgi:hypothetical protein
VVDDKLVFGGRLHRKISRLFASENTVDVAGRAPEPLNVIRRIGDPAAGVDERTLEVDRRQLVAGRNAAALIVGLRRRCSGRSITADRAVA